MPQLHLYLPERVAERVRTRARERGMSVSAWLAELVVRDVSADWPDGFFSEVIGGWQGEPLVRPAQGEHQDRAPMPG
jgi:hypothetical protein